jgi:hypothetical protein
MTDDKPTASPALPFTVITADSDPWRWKMEMLDAVLDGLGTLGNMIGAGADNESALNKLKQVYADVDVVCTPRPEPGRELESRLF